MTFIVEIDWAEDENGVAIDGPVGPFLSQRQAQAWGEEAIWNGEWNVARLHPVPDHTDGGRDA